MKKGITFLGDVHGDWGSLHRAIDQNPDTDVFIQVGDFGIMPKIGSFPKSKGFKKPVLFADGNHEDHDLLAKRVAKGNLEFARNCWYIPRASRLDFNGFTINCIGGAVSIDKYHRTEGKSWWKEEVPSYDEFDRFANLEACDAIVTHDAPHSIGRLVMSHHSEQDAVSGVLDSIWQMLDYQPSYWFFGHHHKPFDKVIKGTRFICLPCTHRHNGQQENYGFSL